jgi:dTDP-4-amino-4,6-dideoxy-D-galactose acyltransferase
MSSNRLSVTRAILAGPEVLEWDSEFFRIPIGRVEVDYFAPDFEHELKPWCAERRIACLYVLGPSDGEAPPVDLRVTYEWDVEGGEAPAPVVRLAVGKDIPALETLARVSHRDSRFYADGRFDKTRCDDLYATWIRRSVEGWADAVWVAVHDGEPAGYLTCHRQGAIGLVAMAQHARGRGLGRQLMNASKNYFRANGVGRVQVVTQGRNTGARALYESCGFRLEGVRYWYHLWFRENVHA